LKKASFLIYPTKSVEEMTVTDIEVLVTMSVLQMGGKCPICRAEQCVISVRQKQNLRSSDSVVECCVCKKPMTLSVWMGSANYRGKI
jgi:hypothetical protein